MKIAYWLILFIIIFPLLVSKVKAADNQFVTIVSPLRGRSIWRDFQNIEGQATLFSKLKLPVTWLIQYENLRDPEVIAMLKGSATNTEIGLFMEIDETLATDALVPYLIGEGDWARPDKLLLSGYTPTQRKRLIDTAFLLFKKRFGYFPHSVGAWYIDTLSLDYMVDFYQISSVMDVSDQYKTDKYGLWGTPWGVPYYPSRLNSIIPAGNLQDKLKAVKIQWAQRDPIRGFGKTVNDSTYSLQANDYIGHHQLDINYFKNIVKDYLNPLNPISQVTLGLEAGQEGREYLGELSKQIEYIKTSSEYTDVSFLTMSDFARIYNKSFLNLSPLYFLHSIDYINPSKEAYWFISPTYRILLELNNQELKLKDLRKYSNTYFQDIFSADKKKDLQRFIPQCIDEDKDYVISHSANDLSVRKEGKNFSLSFIEDGQKRKIIFMEDKIGGELEISFEQKLSFKQSLINKFTSILLGYSENYPHQFLKTIRFANINNEFYIGLMVAPNKLIGFSTQKPYIGTFRFPFQTLIRFKSFPDINPLKYLAYDFIKYDSRCKITL